MPRIAADRSRAAPVSRGQVARRQRILAAAAELGASADFDRVQMLEVAGEADVAIGTLYRYFPSKTHLFAAVFAAEITRCTEHDWPRGGTDPVADVAEGLVMLTRRLRELDVQFHGSVRTLYSTAEAIETFVADADLVVGAVLLPGAAAPKLVSGAMIKRMRPGSVVVDVAIDQGGCFQTSRPTTHAAPTYVVDGVIHYCVTNMPGAVPRTSAFALNNATLPYVHALADKGWERATSEDRGLAAGLNIVRGKVVHPAVARDLGLPTAA